MKCFKVPWQEAEIEFVEKKSRFIGHIYKVQTPEQCQEILAAVRKKYWDATHNVYAYVLQNGVMRFSDDGEPQGTSGMPTLEVLKKEAVFDVMCVTTRYFGGTLLGAGGLVRAYSHTCKLALDAAGQAMMMPYAQVLLECPYNLLERMKLEVAAAQGVLGEIEYGADVRVNALLPAENWPAYEARITELTAGQIAAEKLGETFQAAPAEK